MSPPEYGRTLTGLTVNLIVRDVQASLPFYTEVLGLKALYSDPDFAALEGGAVRMMLHGDHTYDRFEPEVARLAVAGKRGAGAEIRLEGVRISSTAGANAGSRTRTDTCSLSAYRSRSASGWRR